MSVSAISGSSTHNEDYSEFMLNDLLLWFNDHPEAYPDGTEDSVSHRYNQGINHQYASVMTKDNNDPNSFNSESSLARDPSSNGLTDDWKDREIHLLSQKPRSENGGPRRPLNAWLLFRKERSEQLIKSGYKGTAGETSRRLSEEWKSMSPIIKNEHRKLYEKGRTKFNKDNPNYVFARGPNGSRKKRDGSSQKRKISVQSGPIPGSSNIGQPNHFHLQLQLNLMTMQQSLVPPPMFNYLSP
ncbi:hypothetical protein BDQ17DRAFT_1432409 [Cyathus striatus]|nr:hypothetical protein BDQ17DRAFT_1432409 [Cyathus striatus]